MGWLQDTFPEPRNDSTEVERIRYARAYIFEMIGGYLMPDLSRNIVHLRWLLKLVDFRAAGEFSWGFAVLATLHQEICRVTPPNKTKIGGCLSLQQSWVRFRLPLLRPRVNYPYTFSLITRWNHLGSYVGIPTALEDIRLLLDQRSKVQIHGKLYLLLEKQKHQQIRVERERRSPLNPRRMDDSTGPSTAPIQSSGPTPQPMTPTPQPLQIMPGAYPSPYMYPNSYMFPFPSPMPGWNAWIGVSPFLMTLAQSLIYRPPLPKGSHEALSRSSSYYQSLSPYGIQTLPLWVMQTPPHSLFYQGRSSS
ncbi:hypothetical protein CXB51_007558 [Gossypium anomalum]|uniref:Aminotransferase-like plant mobile domain-containing protein n=1 Tax=Gossypium anomalum TaxID=47600 RepID=A0A8J5YU71_9ROSI|nr:hypothetical protein CXB51_007558 [Gossypium anomalum]